jgi:L-threonylcarbamoyladenylate synthase
MSARINADFARAREHLARGGLIAYPTEHCFGLGCDPENACAVRRLLRLKRRPQAKGLILIAADLRQLEPYLAPLPAEDRARLTAYWPGPTTLLMPAAKHAPRWLIGRHRTLAVRVTAHSYAADLCRGLGMALVSTSANLSARRPLRSARACRQVFGTRVMVMSGRVGSGRRPSAIIDFASGRQIRA